MHVRSFLLTTKPLLLLVVLLLGVQGDDRHDGGAREEDYDGEYLVSRVSSTTAVCCRKMFSID